MPIVQRFAQVFGVIYLPEGAAGFVAPPGDLLPLNAPDDIPHLLTAAVALLAYFAARMPAPERGAVRLSVVVPALNEEHHLGELLSDIASQTKAPDEVLVVDAGSSDATASVARRFPFVRLLEATPPVACGRNAGGRSASGDVIVFLDADVRLQRDFFEGFLAAFERRRLDVACPLYLPHGSTPAIEAFHRLFNLLTRATQRVLPSGAGHCIAVRGEIFRGSAGFDPSLRFDDIELIRRLSKGRRFGIVEEAVFVSDRRYREQGTGRMILRYALMGLFFALGKFAWANHISYEFGRHERQEEHEMRPVLTQPSAGVAAGGAPLPARKSPGHARDRAKP